MKFLLWFVALFSIHQTDLTSFSEGGQGAQVKFHVDLGGGLL